MGMAVEVGRSLMKQRLVSNCFGDFRGGAHLKRGSLEGEESAE